MLDRSLRVREDSVVLWHIGADLWLLGHLVGRSLFL